MPSQIENQITEQIRPVLSWISDNLVTPGRVRIQLGKGKAIALIFADASSPSLEEVTKIAPEKRERIEHLFLKNKAGTITSDELTEFKNITGSGDETPIQTVFKAIAVVGRFCEKNFHDHDKLKRFAAGVISLSVRLDGEE